MKEKQKLLKQTVFEKENNKETEAEPNDKRFDRGYKPA